tara:strand:+ start:4057 stop:4725 length:669 start_codon:yes stop_codon:yes gene_type:complete
MPVNSIDIKKCTKWFICGCLSVSFLFWFNWLFPEWFIPSGAGLLGDSAEDKLLWMSFAQIGLVEEAAKGLSFLAISKGKNDHPITTMVGMGMVGIGFGFVENISYAKQYESGILIIRSLTALPFHLILGLIWGWWIASGDIKDWSGRSRLGIWARQNPKGKSILWGFCGMILVTVLHGLYDFNLFMKSPSSTSLMFMQILLCICIAYLGTKNLVTRSRKPFI